MKLAARTLAIGLAQLSFASWRNLDVAASPMPGPIAQLSWGRLGPAKHRINPLLAMP